MSILYYSSLIMLVCLETKSNNHVGCLLNTFTSYIKAQTLLYSFDFHFKLHWDFKHHIIFSLCFEFVIAQTSSVSNIPTDMRENEGNGQEHTHCHHKVLLSLSASSSTKGGFPNRSKKILAMYKTRQ